MTAGLMQPLQFKSEFALRSIFRIVPQTRRELPLDLEVFDKLAERDDSSFGFRAACVLVSQQPADALRPVDSRERTVLCHGHPYPCKGSGWCLTSPCHFQMAKIGG